MKAIIFDLGGVLVYPPRGDWNIPENAKSILGKRADVFFTPAFTKADLSLSAYMDRVCLAKSVSEEFSCHCEYFRALSLALGLSFTQWEISCLAAGLSYLDTRHALYGDVAEYLPILSEKYALGILSDTLPSLYRYLASSGVRGSFARIVTSVETGLLKPHPDTYRTILKKMAVSPEEAYFIDDKTKNLQGARSLGMVSIRMARNHYTNTPVDPAHEIWDGPTVESMKELWEFIGKYEAQ